MKYRYIFVALWAIIILVLCGMPPQDVDKMKFIDFPYLDKVVHFGLYMILGWLVMAVFSISNRLNKSAWIYVLSIVTCFLYGWLIEILQRNFFPGRSYEILDIVADTTGAIVGVLLYFPVVRRIKKN